MKYYLDKPQTLPLWCGADVTGLLSTLHKANSEHNAQEILVMLGKVVRDPEHKMQACPLGSLIPTGTSIYVISKGWVSETDKRFCFVCLFCFSFGYNFLLKISLLFICVCAHVTVQVYEDKRTACRRGFWVSNKLSSLAPLPTEPF